MAEILDLLNWIVMYEDQLGEKLMYNWLPEFNECQLLGQKPKSRRFSVEPSKSSHAPLPKTEHIRSRRDAMHGVSTPIKRNRIRIEVK